MNKRSISIAVLLLFLVVLATVTFLYTSKEDDVEIIHGDLDDIIEDG